MKHKTWDTILFFIKNYKRYIFGILMLSVLYAIFEGLNIAVLFPVINSVINVDVAAGSGGRFIRILNTLIGIIPIKDTFIAACIFIIIIAFLKNIFRYLQTILSAYASYKIWNDVQKELFIKYINADYRYFLDHKHGEITYRLYNATSNVGGILKLIPQLLAEILKVLIIGIILFSMSFSVTCGVIVIAGIFYLFTRGISKKTSYALGKGRIEADEEENILINEMINGIKQIKVFLGEKRWISKFFNAMDAYFRLAKKDTLLVNMPASGLEIFALTALSVFLIFLRKFSPNSLVSNLPLLGVFAYAFQRIMPSLSLITTLKMQIMGGLPVLEMLNFAVNEKMTHLQDGERIISSFNEKIEFRNVSFSYPDRSEALKNISISFEKNKCIAIAGSSGSGKTTMVNLIIRLLDPTKGGIFVDGIDLKDYKKDSWLKKIGFVSQDTFIFHATVSENIAFGLDNVKAEDIVNVAKIANAHDFILELSDGYDTIVGERGMKLSGGEQQRIAIARAILRKPQILIFDEATSALDNTSQSLIQNSINAIAKDRTVILIAHRLSTIMGADRIIVLDQGRIEEFGTHIELMALNGFYAKLYRNEGEMSVSI